MGQFSHVVCLVKLRRVDFVNLVGIYLPLLRVLSVMLRCLEKKQVLLPRHRQSVLADDLLPILPIQVRARMLFQYRATTRICFQRSHCRPPGRGFGPHPVVALRT